jgi:2-polyprenyl-6-methoxyphenol hydroxylase-like FAD-dependent oxidoreductase
VALRLYEDIRRKRTRMLVRYARRLSRIEQSDSAVVQGVRNYVLARTPNRMLTMQARTLRLDLETPV